MPRGGARPNSGPPQDPDALRRDRDATGWLVLQPGDRALDPPAWPLGEQLPLERELWEAEWRRPQSDWWRACGIESLVALYVRTFARATDPTSAAAFTNAAAGLADRLAITEAGLRLARIRVESAAAVATPAEAKPAKKAPARRGTKATAGSSAARMKVLQGGAGGKS